MANNRNNGMLEMEKIYYTERFLLQDTIPDGEQTGMLMAGKAKCCFRRTRNIMKLAVLN